MKRIQRAEGVQASRRTDPILHASTPLRLSLCLCLLALSGCGASGHASGGSQSMERREEKPSTRTFRYSGPPEQAVPLYELWKRNPPEDFGAGGKAGGK